MPSTVSDVVSAGGAEPGGVVRWRSPVPEGRSGVYVVATTNDPHLTASPITEASLSREAVAGLLAVRSELRLDHSRPSVDDLLERLGSFWLRDEVVLYIGRATSLRRRVDQYYRTPLGAAKPHAGGWWLKTLATLDGLWMHWAVTPDFREAEEQMLQAFRQGVSADARAALPDEERVMPFANLIGHDHLIKRHGIAGSRGALIGHVGPSRDKPDRVGASRPSSRETTRHVAHTATPWASVAPGEVSAEPPVTQRVTAKDFEAGRIRLPRPAKELLPQERGEIFVLLRGERLRARWNPRFGPPERSGVLSFGKDTCAHLLVVDEVLRVIGTANADVELS